MTDIFTIRTIPLGLALVLACTTACTDGVDDGVGLGTEHAASADYDPALAVHHGTIATSTGRMEVAYQIVDGQAVVEGDIIVPWTDFVDGTGVDPRAHSATVLRTLAWPGGVVPFTIDGALPNPQRVTDAIAHWRTRTAVQLVARTTETAFVRFSVGAGCSSSVGRTGGEQVIALDATCTTGNVIHEIGHAIGLWHEQSRADRDSFVTIHAANILPNEGHNFNKYGSGVDVGPYDFDSIMHYGSFAFSTGAATITRTNGALIAGQRNGLSPGDLIGVESLYGPPYPIGRGVVRAADGRLAMFVKGADHAIWHAVQSSPGGSFGAWQSLGGNVRSTPTVARNRNGGLEMFAVGWDNQLYRRSRLPSGTWDPWMNMGGQLRGLPVLAQELDGRIVIFGISTSNTIVHSVQSQTNTWGGFGSLGGSFKSNPAIGHNLDGRLTVFAIGTDDTLRMITQSAPDNTFNWGTWSSLGGAIRGTPALGRNLNGTLEVFATGLDGNLRHIWQTTPGGAWTGWSSFGIPVLGSPAVGRNLDGRLEVYAVGLDTSIGHVWQGAPSGGWSGWASYGGTTSTRMPDVGANQDGRQQVFTAGVNDRVLYQSAQVAPNTGWGSWAGMGSLAVTPELGTI